MGVDYVPAKLVAAKASREGFGPAFADTFSPNAGCSTRALQPDALVLPIPSILHINKAVPSVKVGRFKKSQWTFWCSKDKKRKKERREKMRKNT